MVILWLKCYGLLPACHWLLCIELAYVICLLSARHQVWGRDTSSLGYNSMTFCNSCYCAPKLGLIMWKQAGFRNPSDTDFSWLNCCGFWYHLLHSALVSSSKPNKKISQSKCTGKIRMHLKCLAHSRPSINTNC